MDMLIPFSMLLQSLMAEFYLEGLGSNKDDAQPTC